MPRNPDRKRTSFECLQDEIESNLEDAGVPYEIVSVFARDLPDNNKTLILRGKEGEVPPGMQAMIVYFDPDVPKKEVNEWAKNWRQERDT
jgi:hypothetical protein